MSIPAQDGQSEIVPGGCIRPTCFRRGGETHRAWYAIDEDGRAMLHTSRDLAVAALAARPAAMRPVAAPIIPGWRAVTAPKGAMMVPPGALTGRRARTARTPTAGPVLPSPWPVDAAPSRRPGTIQNIQADQVGWADHLEAMEACAAYAKAGADIRRGARGGGACRAICHSGPTLGHQCGDIHRLCPWDRRMGRRQAGAMRNNEGALGDQGTGAASGKIRKRPSSGGVGNKTLLLGLYLGTRRPFS
jgi:hypothetical protein